MATSTPEGAPDDKGEASPEPTDGGASPQGPSTEGAGGKTSPEVSSPSASQPSVTNQAQSSESDAAGGDTGGDDGGGGSGVGSARSQDQAENQSPDSEESSGAGGTGSAGEGPASSGKMAKLGSDMKSQAADGAMDAGVDHVVGGDPGSAKNRYAKAAAKGAAKGAAGGGAHGAAVGTATGVGKEAVGDVGGEVIKRTGMDSAQDKDEPGGNSDEGADAASGAGGTGPAGPDAGTEGPVDRKSAMAAGGVAAAAPAGANVMVMMVILSWLAAMAFKAAAVAQTFGAMVVAAIKALGTFLFNTFIAPFVAPVVAVGGFFSAVGGAIFGAGSVMASSAAGLASVAVAGVMGLTMAIGGVTGAVMNSQGSEGLQSSGTRCTVSTADGSNGDLNVDATTEKQAQAVYSVLKEWDTPDENIAGILGNWSQESGIDPTSVQGFPVSMYEMTDAKKSAAQTTSKGLGLGQWTGARNTLLREYAKEKGQDWWSLELQLAFMADESGDNPSDVKVFNTLINESQGSPGEAAKYFHDEWERSADTGSMVEKRARNAEDWYGRMSGWTVDKSIADKIKDFFNGAGELVNGVITGAGGVCGEDEGSKGGNVSLKDGGMSKEDAQAFVDLYNEEGDKYLDDTFGPGGGPGSCNGNHAMNCVSFSVYFVNKYTSFKDYPRGNGIDTAGTIASMTGKKLSDTPTAYSVASGPGSGPAGHTFVVLGVEGDKVILGEAGYCAFMGRVRETTVGELQSAGWKFVDMSDLLTGGDDIEV